MDLLFGFTHSQWVTLCFGVALVWLLAEGVRSWIHRPRK